LVFDSNELHYLKGDKIDGDRTVFTGYPKSGTSLLRKYLEKPTGLLTGSDVSLTYSLPAQMQGRKGLGIVDDRVWFVQSHFPLLTPEAEYFKTNKLIVIVRNPLDVIASLA